MTTRRATVITKTDISGSTVRFRALAEADPHTLLIGTVWETRLTLVDVRPPRHAGIEVYRLGNTGPDSN